MTRTYYAASYGPRYGDPVATIVALEPLHELRPSLIQDKVNEANERSAQFEMAEYPGYCDTDHSEDGSPSIDDCSLCTPDISIVDAYSYRGCDLFTAAELREHRRDLVAGKVIVLYR